MNLAVDRLTRPMSTEPSAASSPLSLPPASPTAPASLDFKPKKTRAARIKPRYKVSEEQLPFLLEEYAKNSKPCNVDKERIAGMATELRGDKLVMTVRNVRVWFNNE